MGLDPEADGWALREVKRLCGLTLGGEDAPEDRQFSRDQSVRPVKQRPDLRVVAGTAVQGRQLDQFEDPDGMGQGIVGEHLHCRAPEGVALTGGRGEGPVRADSTVQGEGRCCVWGRDAIGQAAFE